jgi:hypothetical protein
VPELALVQVHLHAITLPGLRDSLHLGSRRPWACLPTPAAVSSTCLRISVCTNAPHYSDDSRKDHAAFHLHLGLHHVPGRSGHRRRCVWSRRTARRVRLRHIDRQSPAPVTIVVAILFAPRSMRTPSPCLLARARSARPLSVADTSVRQKPPATFRAGSLLPHSDTDHRRPRHRRLPRCRC